MKESVITVNFDVESEAYQALSEIKRHPDGSGYFVSAASLIKKENGHIVLKDGFDTGVDTADAIQGEEKLYGNNYQLKMFYLVKQIRL